MQLTTPHVDWTDINTNESRLDILDYVAELALVRRDTYAWRVRRGPNVLSQSTATDEADARDAVEDAIRRDFTARHPGA